MGFPQWTGSLYLHVFELYVLFCKTATHLAISLTQHQKPTTQPQHSRRLLAQQEKDTHIGVVVAGADRQSVVVLRIKNQHCSQRRSSLKNGMIPKGASQEKIGDLKSCVISFHVISSLVWRHFTRAWKDFVWYGAPPLFAVLNKSVL